MSTVRLLHLILCCEQVLIRLVQAISIILYVPDARSIVIIIAFVQGDLLFYGEKWMCYILLTFDEVVLLLLVRRFATSLSHQLVAFCISKLLAVALLEVNLASCRSVFSLLSLAHLLPFRGYFCV